MSEIKESEDVLVRNTFSNGRKMMYNNYIRTTTQVDRGNWIRDAVVCPHIAEEMIQEEYLDYYEEDLNLQIVETRDDIFVAVTNIGDDISCVSINKDGSVFGSCHKASPDLDNGSYYHGDEVTYLGERAPYKNDNLWLWYSILTNVKTVNLVISKETIAMFIEERKDYLVKQANK